MDAGTKAYSPEDAALGSRDAKKPRPELAQNPWPHRRAPAFLRAIDFLTPEGRVGELARVLAAGLIRFRARKSSEISTDQGESSLDITGHQSGHPTPVTRRISDG